MTGGPPLRERVQRHLQREGLAPGAASPPRVAGDPAVDAAPGAVETVLQALADDTSGATVADRRTENGHDTGATAGAADDDGTAGETASIDDGAGQSPGGDRGDSERDDDADDGTAEIEAARAAFADAVDWYHEKLKKRIDDHTDAGDHPDRPTTAKEYFEEARGWEEDTVEDRCLGWAPGEQYKDEIIRDLFNAGHDREAILATGLFSDDLQPLWRGRYVLPYFDADGRPVYAIARCTGDAGGGAAGYDGHPEDFLAGKYAKVRHTDDRVPLDEPIWGLDTLRAGEPVVVAEGIADAITAVEAGYAALSPVAKEVKREHIDRLVEAVEAYDVPRVYVVPDAERPSVSAREDRPDDPDRIGEVLSIPAVSAGLGGALRTAHHLREHGVETMVAPLPRPGLDKVDLDDYLHGWADDLDAVLASARPPAAFDAYDDATRHLSDDDGRAATARDSADRRGEYDRGRDDGRTDDVDAVDPADPHVSSLWALDMADVTPDGYDSAGDRGRNPAAHRGTSENYFVLREGRTDGELVATDYKGRGGKARYSALTYLLVAAGERDRDGPEGSLSDREVWVAWREARENDVVDLPLEGPDGEALPDPIPRRATWHLAREHDLAPEADIPEGSDGYDDRLPADAREAVLEVVREDYGLDPHRPVDDAPGGDDDAGHSGPLAALGAARLAALDTDEARRHARRRGLDWPTTDAVRDRIADRLRTALADGERTVLAPPTGAGKSYAVATTSWRDVDEDVTGGRPVVHLHETRDTRDQLATESRAAGADHRVLLSGFEACPVAGGAHDPVDEDAPGDDPDEIVTVDGVPASDWFDEMVNDRGVPFSVAHGVARERHDQGRPHLPCCPGDQRCRSETQWTGVPTDDDGDPTADVVHATHQFAHVPSIRTETNVILDERPDYALDLDHDRARRAVSAFLNLSDVGPDTYEELVSIARQYAESGDAYPWNEHVAPRERGDLDQFRSVMTAVDYDPPTDWYFSHPDAHTAAPAIAEAVFDALYDPDPFDATGRASARTTHEPPRFDDDARKDEFWNQEYVTVVVDDANTIRRVRSAPNFSGARAVVGLDAHPAPRKWRRNAGPDVTVDPVLDPEERQLWRVFERGLKIVQVGDADRPAGADGRFHDLDGDRAVLARLRAAGFDVSTAIAPKAVEDDVAAALGAAGADDPETMHYGEEKSRDDFAGEDAGYVTHTIDPGDDHVVNWLAECGLEARPERVVPEDVDDTDGAACEACGGDGCRECGDTGRKRVRGRGFVGPDAEAADQLLASVRATHVLQAVGRYARDAADPDDHAWVFVRTAVLPDSHVDLAVPGVQWTPTDCQASILRALERRETATAREVAAATDASKEHVRQTLTRLVDEGRVRCRERAGDHGAHLYRALGGLGTTAGIVDLAPVADATHDPPDAAATATADVTDVTNGPSPDTAATGAAGDDEGDPAATGETTNDPVLGSHTWSLAIRMEAPGTPTLSDGSTATGRRSAATAAAGTGNTDDPPPGTQLQLDAFTEPPPAD